MRSTITPGPSQPEFPRLMRVIRNPTKVILATSRPRFGKLAGTIVAIGLTPFNDHHLGYHTTDWSEDVFEPFTGSITLENS